LGPLVYNLAAASFTGVLTLEQDSRKYNLWFAAGLIADADSPSPEDQIGRILLQRGMITNAQVGESIRIMAQSPHRKQLDILVEMGAVAAEHVPQIGLMGLA